MAIHDIYSKRQRRIRGEVSDVYIYDNIPQKFKIQFIHIIEEAIGICTTHTRMSFSSYQHNTKDNVYKRILKTLLAEYGRFKLKNDATSYSDEIFSYFLTTSVTDHSLDIIELFCIELLSIFKNPPSIASRDRAVDALSGINTRFKENNIGYQFENEEIIRVDSQFIHSEVVKPTLSLLSSNDEYDGVMDEFLAAHEHYRLDNFKECLNECLKSYESIMKAIHDKRKWQYNKTDTASKLINSCLEHELIPSYLQGQFTSLKTMLESGIPTIRNKNSGHGQGTGVTTVPRELVSYMLHLTATNILFLAQSEQSL
ncbi:TPA: hypothetical protein QH887_003015 [Klebsiella aerogenes]|nr:hypothetical protein [Klebsiella aerogenes]